MGPSRFPSARVHPAAAIGLILLCGALLLWFLWPVHQLVEEVYGILAILLAFGSWPPLRRWVAEMPMFHRLIFLGLVGAMLVGHLTLAPRTYFPFVSWEIFTIGREADPVTCREFMGTTASGRSVRLLVEQLFPSIVQFNPPAESSSTAMTQLVHAMARVYNRKHRADPVRRVDLVELAVKLHLASGQTRTIPTCEPIKSYDVSSDR